MHSFQLLITKIFKFLWFLFSINWRKSITLCFLFLFISIFNSHYKQEIDSVDRVVSATQPFQDRGKFYYTVYDGEEIKIKESNTFIPVTNGTITYKSEQPITIVSAIIIFILSLVLIISIFVSDEGGWEISEVLSKLKNSNVKCEEEGGKYYYIYSDRLLYVSDHILQSWESREIISTALSTGLNFYPKYQSKQDKRDSKISKILS